MLRIGERRQVTAATPLDDAMRAQFIALGSLYDGKSLSPEERFSDDAATWGSTCYVAPVLDGDTHVYDAWFVMVDSGAVFRRGTTQYLAGIIQFGLECPDRALRDELGAALVAAGLLPHYTPADDDEI